jgi:RNA polymerase sigma factor (sigma-70 family)
MLLNMSETDWELLQRYRRNHAEEAFTELVRRHVNLVFSAALRQIRAPQLAEEIAQSVFSDLARQAAQLPADTVLAAWLHQVTRCTAIDVVRREARRQLREQIATEMNATHTPDANWTHIEPLLDEAVLALDDADRAAVLLRYFENKSLREVGQQLGVSDDAAQKRVSRAVERLREFFSKRGVTVGTSGLVVVISANAVQAAPIGLAAAISTAALTAGTLIATTITTQTTMNWITAKSISAIIAAAVAAGTGTYLVQQHSAAPLRAENQQLAVAQQTLAKERDDALAAVAANAEELKRREPDKAELMRLRGEVGQLRRQAKDAGDLAEQNRQLREAFNALAQKTAPPADEPEADPERRFAIERLNQSKQLVLGLLMYAGDNADMLPTDLNSISNYFGNAASELIGNHPFELVLQGSLKNVPNPATTIAVRSKSPFIMNGKSVKVYGFADGHAELKREPEEGFEAWEKQRMIPAVDR